MVENTNPTLKKQQTKQTLTQLLAAAIILISGIAIGVGTTVILVKYRVIWIKHKHLPTPHQMALEVDKKYDLTDTQFEKVKQNFEKAKESKDDLRNQIHSKIDLQRQQLIEEMKIDLTPQQFERWNADFQQKIEKLKRRYDSKKK